MNIKNVNPPTFQNTKFVNPTPIPQNNITPQNNKKSFFSNEIDKSRFNDLNLGFLILYISIVVIGIISILIFFSLGIVYLNNVSKLEKTQSNYCYTFSCLCESENVGPPCYGFAKRNVGENFSCSNAPNSIVDKNGKLIS
jgi:hypothetical protein